MLLENTPSSENSPPKIKEVEIADVDKMIVKEDEVVKLKIKDNE